MSTLKEHKSDFSVKILKHYCKGCGLCISVCREEKIDVNPLPNERGIQQALIVPDADCSGCLRCSVICPEGGIEIYRHGSQSENAKK